MLRSERLHEFIVAKTVKRHNKGQKVSEPNTESRLGAHRGVWIVQEIVGAVLDREYLNDVCDCPDSAHYGYLLNLQKMVTRLIRKTVQLEVHRERIHIQGQNDEPACRVNRDEEVSL